MTDDTNLSPFTDATGYGNSFRSAGVAVAIAILALAVGGSVILCTVLFSKRRSRLRKRRQQAVYRSHERDFYPPASPASASASRNRSASSLPTPDILLATKPQLTTSSLPSYASASSRSLQPSHSLSTLRSGVSTASSGWATTAYETEARAAKDQSELEMPVPPIPGYLREEQGLPRSVSGTSWVTEFEGESGGLEQPGRAKVVGKEGVKRFAARGPGS